MKTVNKEVQASSVKDIGQYIRSVRKSHGMNQQALSDLTGVNRRFLSELENGKETAECGKVLHVLRCIGCDVILRSRK